MADCYALLKDCKRAGERLDWAFNWTMELARRWKPDVPFAVGVAVRPSELTAQTGLEYVSSGGQTGSDEPAWPLAVGDVVTSGTITFTAQAVSIASLQDQISTSAWASDEPSITIDHEDQSATAGLQQTSAFIAGGVTRRKHDIVNTMTTVGGKVFEGVLRLTIDP